MKHALSPACTRGFHHWVLSTPVPCSYLPALEALSLPQFTAMSRWAGSPRLTFPAHSSPLIAPCNTPHHSHLHTFAWLSLLTCTIPHPNFSLGLLP